jgi:transcriptional regulator with XRE-family HTH domain
MSEEKEFLSKEDFGRLLKAQRENVGLSQGKVAENMGYKNLNFISLIELGKSRIPFGKIMKFCDSYQFPTEFAIVIIAAQYPEYIDTIFNLTKRIPKIFKQASEDVDGTITQIIGKFESQLA